MILNWVKEINMSEKIDEKKDEEVLDTTAENAGEKTKETKTFTQGELDKIVKDRLSREKDSSKKLLDTAGEERTALEDTIKNFEGIIKQIVDEKKKEIPSNYLALFEKLTLSEQYEFLITQEKTLVDKKKIPLTPNAKEADTKIQPTKKIVKIF